MSRFVSWCGLTTLALLASTVSSAQADVPKELRDSWVASSGERDGKSYADVVGHRLVFTAKGFKIHSKEGKLLYEGTVTVEEDACPAAIDFVHSSGNFKGKTWKGIYAVKAGKLTICDNAFALDKPRPKSFEAKADSGYVCITFVRSKP